MEDYETVTKKGTIEKRIYIDSGRFVIYGYESEGKISNKHRVVLNGGEKRSFFLIDTGKGRKLSVDSEYEDSVCILKEGKSVKISDLL
jgi:hypothetical protein